MRILIVEDESAISGFLKEGLEEEGFAVDLADNGRKGLELALDFVAEYDVMLLDWMLLGISGIEICRSVRKVNQQVPIIFLTAKDTVDDTVFALETGANDYLKKPFAFEELLARIRVLMRKSSSEQVLFSILDIQMNVDIHEVTKAGKQILLTQKEFALFELLLRNKGKVCRRSRIMEKIWDAHFDKDTAVIDVFINGLRKKLDEVNQVSFIQTIRGVGYRINEEE